MLRELRSVVFFKDYLFVLKEAYKIRHLLTQLASIANTNERIIER